MRKTAAAIMVVAGLCTLAGCGGTGKEKPTPEASTANRIRLAQAYLNAGRMSEALAEVQQAIDVQPANAGLRNFQGQVLFLSGRYPDAEAAYRKALEIDPYLTDAHNNLGALYDRMGRKDDAEREFRVALAEPTYPTPEKVRYNLALLYLSQGRDAEALTELRRAVEIAPRYYQAHFTLASLLDRTGKLEEAAREYEVAAPDVRSDGEYQYRLGFAYYRLGDRAKAEEHLRRAQEVSPGSESAAKADELLRMMR